MKCHDMIRCHLEYECDRMRQRALLGHGPEADFWEEWDAFAKGMKARLKQFGIAATQEVGGP